MLLPLMELVPDGDELDDGDADAETVTLLEALKD